MVLSELELQHFRNLGVQELRFPPEGAAIIGENAQGKTNLLEAIYYLESFRSFRGAPDEQLVAFTNLVFHVAGTVAGSVAGTVASSMAGTVAGDEDRPSTRVSAAFDRSRRKKKVTLDGTPASRLTDGLGHLCAVVFSPGDVALVSGGPSIRRRFLNVVLSLNVEGYVVALQRYQKALAQRNASLKAGMGRGAVEVWDEPLVQAGTRVIEERRTWVDDWASAFSEHYSAISGGEGARLRYRASIGTTRNQSIEDSFRDDLAESAEREERQRATVVGPHRDDLTIELGDEASILSARSYGSGGQQRTAALALRLIEAATVRSKRGTDPLLLLDDAFAELDEGRSERIMELIDKEGTGQVILTAPKDSDVRFRRGSLPRWGIEEGVIQA